MEVEPTKAEEEQEEVRDEEAEEAAAEGAERKSRGGGDGDDFYLRYYVGHKGRFGHEFLEFEVLPTGELRYANNSNYKHEHIIRKKAFLTGSVLRELRRIVEESGVLGLDDARWPMPDAVGKQELEVAAAGQHVSFLTAKIGSLLDVQQSQDPDGLRVLYYTVQDIKCFVLSLIGLHFKIKPII